jgi:hypothetical protein
MKTSKKIIYSAAAIAFTGLLVYVTRRSNTKRRIAEVADEGYETAADLLHPKTSSRFKKLHYGPVLPEHY